MAYEVLAVHDLLEKSELLPTVPRVRRMTEALNNQKTDYGMVLVAIDNGPEETLYVFRHETD